MSMILRSSSTTAQLPGAAAALGLLEEFETKELHPKLSKSTLMHTSGRPSACVELAAPGARPQRHGVLEFHVVDERLRDVAHEGPDFARTSRLGPS